MKRVIHLLLGVWVAIGMGLAGCSAAAQLAATATAVRPAAINATATLGAASRTTTRQPAATATSTPVPALFTPTVASPTQPASTATRAISTAGSLPIPEKRQPLVFAANASFSVVTASLAENQPVAYQFTAAAGQVAYLAVAGATNLQVFGPNQAPVSKNVTMPGYLSLVLPDAGNYMLVLQGRVNNITLSLYLPPVQSNLASAAPLPEKPQAVTLPVLPYTVTFPSRLDPAAPQAYTFPAQAGQVLSLAVSGSLTATVLAPDGNSLTADTDALDTPWIFILPETGTYSLVLLGSGVVNVTARLTPAPGGTPLAASLAGGSSSILIAPGQKSVALRTYFTPNKTQTYVLRLPAGQRLYVDVAGNALVTQITGPDQKPLTLNNAPLTQRWSANISAAGEYTLTFSGAGTSILTFSVPIPISVP